MTTREKRITLLGLLIAATVATIICCFRPVPAFGGEWLLIPATLLAMVDHFN
ncbi:MAG: hypothetical protein PHY23_06450 [Oscillospiraceae bacterium]|nr:hypothetical protein [Oscillospiraceae bacterium]MDD4510521.1 hypothetical protein [Oscillospiraceae bacterium]